MAPPYEAVRVQRGAAALIFKLQVEAASFSPTRNSRERDETAAPIIKLRSRMLGQSSTQDDNAASFFNVQLEDVDEHLHGTKFRSRAESNVSDQEIALQREKNSSENGFLSLLAATAPVSRMSDCVLSKIIL